MVPVMNDSANGNGTNSNGSQPPSSFSESSPWHHPEQPRGDLSNVALLKLGETLPPQRLKFGLRTLDKLTHSGMPFGSLLVLVGAPGAGKTALALQFVHDWYSLSAPNIVFLSADQRPSAMLIRLAQRCGFSREDLEGLNGEDSRQTAIKDAASSLAYPRVYVIDGADEKATIEGCLLLLETLRAANGKPCVLVVDSLQQCRCDAAEDIEDMRLRIDAKLQVIQKALAQGVLVVAISEMARGAYKNRDKTMNTSGIASAKESSKTEYLAEVLLAMRSVAGSPDLVDVEIAKSRISTTGEFRLRLLRNSATLVEVDIEEDESVAVERAKMFAMAKELLPFALKAVETAPPGGKGYSYKSLRAIIKAGGLDWGKDTLDAVCARLTEADGVLGWRMRIIPSPKNGVAAQLYMEQIPCDEHTSTYNVS